MAQVKLWVQLSSYWSIHIQWPSSNLQPPPNVEFVTGPYIYRSQWLGAIPLLTIFRLPWYTPGLWQTSSCSEGCAYFAMALLFVTYLRRCALGHRGPHTTTRNQGKMGTHRASQSGDTTRWWCVKHVLRLCRTQSCQSVEFTWWIFSTSFGEFFSLSFILFIIPWFF